MTRSLSPEGERDTPCVLKCTKRYLTMKNHSVLHPHHPTHNSVSYSFFVVVFFLNMPIMQQRLSRQELICFHGPQKIIYKDK